MRQKTAFYLMKEALQLLITHPLPIRITANRHPELDSESSEYTSFIVEKALAPWIPNQVLNDKMKMLLLSKKVMCVS